MTADEAIDVVIAGRLSYHFAVKDARAWPCSKASPHCSRLDEWHVQVPPYLSEIPGKYFYSVQHDWRVVGPFAPFECLPGLSNERNPPRACEDDVRSAVSMDPQRGDESLRNEPSDARPSISREKHCRWCNTKRPNGHNEPLCRFRFNALRVAIVVAVLAFGAWYVATFAEVGPVLERPLTMQDVLDSVEFRCAQLRRSVPPSRLPLECGR